MFKVVEMPTAKVLGTFETFNEADQYIQNITSSEYYSELLTTYGSERRVQQELTIESF